MFRRSDHGRFLINLGFEEDVNYCATADVSSVVPIVAKSLLLPSGAFAARIVRYQPSGKPTVTRDVKK